MKIIQFSTVLVAFLLLGNLTASAQEKATDIFSRPDISVDVMFEKGLIDWNSTFSIIPETPIPLAPVIAKQLSIPNKAKVFNGKMKAVYNNTCYEFRCASGSKGCKDCQMVWWDRNGDRKVQPRKEVRCFCSATKTVCKIGGKKIECP